MKRNDTGRLGEDLAADFLRKKGFKIVETNYRCPEGEIDIIARNKDTLSFVEVRTKTSHSFGSPEESITRAKKRRMVTTARRYLQSKFEQPPDWRIDFIAVELDNNNKPLRIELFENAIGEM